MSRKRPPKMTQTQFYRDKFQPKSETGEISYFAFGNEMKKLNDVFGLHVPVCVCVINVFAITLKRLRKNDCLKKKKKTMKVNLKLKKYNPLVFAQCMAGKICI